MSTVVTKKDFKYVILFAVHITLFFIIHMYFKVAAADIKNQFDKLYESYDHAPSEQVMQYLSQQEFLETQFAFIYAISALILIYVLYKAKNDTNYNIIGLLLLFTVIYTLLPIGGDFSAHIETAGYATYKYYSYYCLFLPYTFLIIRYSIIGIKEDVTEQVKQKEENVHNDKTDDLDKLFKLNLLSEEEYFRKKEVHIKEKIRVDLKDSEEYSLLLKSKQKGLLTEEEFTSKFENLVILKYNKNE